MFISCKPVSCKFKVCVICIQWNWVIAFQMAIDSLPKPDMVFRTTDRHLIAGVEKQPLLESRWPAGLRRPRKLGSWHVLGDIGPRPLATVRIQEKKTLNDIMISSFWNAGFQSISGVDPLRHLQIGEKMSGNIATAQWKFQDIETEIVFMNFATANYPHLETISYLHMIL